MSRRTHRSPKEPAVFAIALIALIALAVTVVVARLATVVMNDRPLTVPRSHTHELDPQSTRLYRVV
jgi:uncharacterized protein (DUF2062 family)